MSAPAIAVAAPPSTAAVASQILALMAAESGVLTDYNPGSQIRTESEAIGSVVEQQGIWAQAQAFQALVYGAFSLFGDTPDLAVAASGTVTFSSSAPVSQNVSIPAGTIAQTAGGIQVATTVAGILAAGNSSIDLASAAVVSGAAGNVSAGAITQLVSALTYPLQVNNANPFGGGADAQSAADALSEFASMVNAIGLSSPVAIANAAIGTAYGAETVKFSTLAEPWILAGSGAGSGVAGWNLYIDNGLGTASSGLVNAVIAKLNGGSVSGVANPSGATGYRDAGVPYNVYVVTGTLAVVSATGAVMPGASASLVSGAMASAISGYFKLPFGAPAIQAQLAASAANAALGQLSSLTVSLYQSGSGTALSLLTPAVTGRVVLAQMNLFVS